MVVSDLHLCDVESHPDGWKAYKHPRYAIDRDFDRRVARFEDTVAEELVLVLNGDIFDFDLVTALPADPPWPVSRAERARGLDPTEGKSAFKLEHMLADHPLFLQTLVRFMAAGHRVVYVIGNHDPEMHFPAVQRVFRAALARRASELGCAIASEQLRIEPWFYHVPGEIYVEHGQQYDHYTSFRHVLSPVIDTDPPRIALPMGDLSNRYLMSHMGFFNPHASDYILNIYRYLVHWLRHYAFNAKRHLALPWFFGSLAVLMRMLALKRLIRTCGPDHDELLTREAARQGLALETLRTLDKLRRAPIANRLYRMVREFWIDRLLLALLMTGGTITLAVLPIPLWIKLMVPLSSFPLLFSSTSGLPTGRRSSALKRRCRSWPDAFASFCTFLSSFSGTPMSRPMCLSAWARPTSIRVPGRRSGRLASRGCFRRGCATLSWHPSPKTAPCGSTLTAGYRSRLVAAVSRISRQEMRR